MLTEKNALSIWLKTILPSDDYNISSLAGDASLRQYYRITFADQSRILMDSHLDISAFHKFIEITTYLDSCNLPAPQIYATNATNYFALIEDFGNSLLLDVANQNNREILYKNSLDILVQMQNCANDVSHVPSFNTQQILTELNLFYDWFINKYLQLEFTGAEKQVLTKASNLLVDILLSMPQTFSHMDFHSRNIMVLKDSKIGIIDYQDAKISPFTYDLVSILKDCYVKLPKPFLNNLLDYYYSKSNIAKSLTHSEFIRAFNLCGLQRHIKVLGIFSRLHIRDNKSKYLEDLPLVLNYTLDCLKIYKEFADFYDILSKLNLTEKFSYNVCD